MKITDEGVIGSSWMDFTIPSEFARSALYCCPNFGHFICDSHYSIDREFLDLFLLMYIRRGSLVVETGGHTVTALPGYVVLLDCHRPHRYFCPNQADFLWFHYSGNSSEAYGKYLLEKNGILFRGESVQALEELFEEIHRIARLEIVEEHEISLLVNRILCALSHTEERVKVVHTVLRSATDYIHANYHESIDLDKLSKLCSISKPHLIRSFKRYMNCTPHEYLLSCRLRKAKQYLVNSSESVESIAELCGFNSASHFARAFHKSVGMTPTEFRNL